MACNEDLALDQRDNVVRRPCINTRRHANIVIHANTTKTYSEKSEYFLEFSYVRGDKRFKDFIFEGSH
jgi:hypothetical protein